MADETTNSRRRAVLAELLPLVARGERVVIADDAGCPLAALVPIALLAELDDLREQVMDLEDIMAADAAVAEPGESVPLEQVRAELEAAWAAAGRAAA